MIELQVIGQVLLMLLWEFFMQGLCSVVDCIIGMNSSCGHYIQNTESILENGAARDVIFEKKTQTIVSSRLSPFSKQRFLYRLRPLKEAGLISIHAINHFLNEVSSFEMLCVTPE